jgi:hypothetical protein
VLGIRYGFTSGLCSSFEIRQFLRFLLVLLYAFALAIAWVAYDSNDGKNDAYNYACNYWCVVSFGACGDGVSSSVFLSGRVLMVGCLMHPINWNKISIIAIFLIFIS